MNTNLENEISEKRKTLTSTSLQLSINEVATMYKEDEIIINPIYQRFFRWTSSQKTKFIESLLLGIPTPPIYVNANPDGKWEVVDGLQRISTLLQFMGLLKNEKGELLEFLKLEKTKYLPSLENYSWIKSETSTELPTSVKLQLKRTHMHFQVISKESDQSAKYELFQRLNTGGTALSTQEVRNCLMIMLNPKMYEWLESLASNDEFKASIFLSENDKKERYEMELLIRFYSILFSNIDKINTETDLSDFMNEKTYEFASENTINFDAETEKFKKTFNYIQANIKGYDTFRKFKAGRSSGQFLESVFESILIGIYSNIDFLTSNNVNLNDKLNELWQIQEFNNFFDRGKKAFTRIKLTIPYCINFFSK